MCNTNPVTMVLPYGLKVSAQSPYVHFGVSPMSLDIQRAQQLYDYSARLQYGLGRYPNGLGLSPYHPSPAEAYMHHYFKDPRARFIHEEPKPNHSYIGLIAMAILSSRDKKLVLSDIYQWILDNYPYFRTRGPGWRNSIRHNLSLNDCFIKAGRSANGKGHFWAIHPANVDDFQKGDFRRRRAQRRVRKHMGLSVPDDDDSPTPSPNSTHQNWDENDQAPIDEKVDDEESVKIEIVDESDDLSEVEKSTPKEQPPTRKRLFDVESLLAPDDIVVKRPTIVDLRNISFRHSVEDLSKKSTSDSNSVHSENSEKENLSRGSGYEEMERTDNKMTEEVSREYMNVFNRESVMMVSRPSAFTNNTHARAWNSLMPYLATYPYIRRQNGLGMLSSNLNSVDSQEISSPVAGLKND